MCGHAQPQLLQIIHVCFGFSWCIKSFSMYVFNLRWLRSFSMYVFHLRWLKSILFQIIYVIIHLGFRFYDGSSQYSNNSCWKRLLRFMFGVLHIFNHWCPIVFDFLDASSHSPCMFMFSMYVFNLWWLKSLGCWGAFGWNPFCMLGHVYGMLGHVWTPSTPAFANHPCMFWIFMMHQVILHVCFQFEMTQVILHVCFPFEMTQVIMVSNKLRNHTSRFSNLWWLKPIFK
jgi:hypothetical protein